MSKSTQPSAPDARDDAKHFARVTGTASDKAAKAAIYALPIAGSYVAYRVVGGGLLGLGAALVTFPVVFIGTGVALVWKYGPGSKS